MTYGCHHRPSRQRRVPERARSARGGRRAPRPHRRTDPAQHPRHPHGPARRDPPTQAPGRDRWRPDAANAPAHQLRHTFVTTMLDAGVSLRDVQIATRHADPRTTMRYDRARNNLDRHPNYILAAYMASGT
ncbi:tyrosine-type recombinase/integrase [Dactylosporangium sp. NPDC000521]|uniref:tyrosine-type recombinase/integrase n=1 Tax=Dactylosporangium sp. NPDC000521 TaxID=3363975 RepID=UPI003679E270